MESTRRRHFMLSIVASLGRWPLAKDADQQSDAIPKECRDDSAPCTGSGSSITKGGMQVLYSVTAAAFETIFQHLNREDFLSHSFGTRFSMQQMCP